MSGSSLGTKTLDLLAQYDNHISERDRSIEYIEKKSGSYDEEKPQYDELFKENIKLKLQVKEYEAEIESLKQVIELLKRKHGDRSDDIILNQINSMKRHNTDDTDFNTVKNEPILPPRSADRRSHNNIKELTLPLTNSKNIDDKSMENNTEMQQSETKSSTIEPLSTVSSTQTSNNDSVETPRDFNSTNPFVNMKSIDTPVLNTGQVLDNIGGSPATSVTYTTSRITIKSPNRAVRSPLQERVSSPQNPNRMTSIINDQITSPVKNRYEARDIEFNTSPIQFKDGEHSLVDLNSSPVLTHTSTGDGDSNNNNNNNNNNNEGIDFSPAAKAKINNFTKLLESSFGDEEISEQSIVINEHNGNHNNESDDVDIEEKQLLSNAIGKNQVPTPTISIDKSPSKNILASPVLVNKADSESIDNQASVTTSLQQQSSVVSAADLHIKGRVPTNESFSSNSNSWEANELREINTNNRNMYPESNNVSQSTLKAQNTVAEPNDRSDMRMTSMGTMASATSIVSDIPLFVQPQDFGTIKIEVLSTLFQEPDPRFEEYLILISVIDRTSDKEMFKFSKSIQKIRELDVYLKSHVSSLSLPSLPDRSLFQSTLPIKIGTRGEQMNNYFHSIFSVPEFPPNVGLKIAQFLSTDTVMNPVMMDETSKEGTLIIRRPKKTLGNAFTWKVKYGTINGDSMQLFEKNHQTDLIKLRQCTIELLPNLPDDRYGTKNGFLINEHKKSGLSSTSKYYICTETAKERESWIAAINEFCDNSMHSNHSHTSSVSSVTNWSGTTAGVANEVYRLGQKNDSPTISNILNQSTENLNEPRGHLNMGDSSSTPSNASSPHHQYQENANNMTDKEIRRLKMRSIFPFKKLNINSNGPSISSTSQSSTTNSNTIEPVTIISQDSEYIRSEHHNVDTGTTFNNVDLNHKVVFGTALNDCLKLSSRNYQGIYEIPSVVYRCLEYLYKNQGLREEGIFRLSGSSTQIKSLQDKFDREYDLDLCLYEQNDEDSYLGVNTVSGLLKLYLRNLPHLIFGDEQFLSLKKIVDEFYSDPKSIALQFQRVIDDGEIPKPNVSLMYALFELLSRIDENKKINKMNLRNLCIVFSPTLNIPITMLQPFIVDFKCIFKGEQPIPDEEREHFDIKIPQL